MTFEDKIKEEFEKWLKAYTKNSILKNIYQEDSIKHALFSSWMSGFRLGLNAVDEWGNEYL